MHVLEKYIYNQASNNQTKHKKKYKTNKIDAIKQSN